MNSIQCGDRLCGRPELLPLEMELPLQVLESQIADYLFLVEKPCYAFTDQQTMSVT